MDGRGLTIRDARRDDSAAVGELLSQLGYPAPIEAVARRIERFADSSADRLVVAELGGFVVGLAALHVSAAVEYDEDAGKLSAIVVDEAHRRRGIGEALVAAIEREARERGCCLLFLTTAKQRAGAHDFYRHTGFEETGRRFAKRLD